MAAREAGRMDEATAAPPPEAPLHVHTQAQTPDHEVLSGSWPVDGAAGTAALASPSASTSHGARRALKLTGLSPGAKEPRRRKADDRSRNWAALFGTLRRTVDEIYGVCRADRSALECKEAALILRRSAEDFDALIQALGVEDRFDHRPHEGLPKPSVAWEIRKTVASPSKPLPPPLPRPFLLPPALPPSPHPTDPTTDPTSPLSSESSYADKVKGLQPKPPAPPEQAATTPEEESKTLVAASEAGEETLHPEDHVPDHKPEEDDDSWSLVKRRVGRRKGRKGEPGDWSACGPLKSKNVGSHVARLGADRNLMAPRSVMDIPQTRSSMAKIAYSRKRLFEQKQPELRQKWAAQARAHPAPSSQPRKASSFPAVHRLGQAWAAPPLPSAIHSPVPAAPDGRLRKKKLVLPHTDSLASLASIAEEGKEQEDPVALSSPLPHSEGPSPREVAGLGDTASLPADLAEILVRLGSETSSQGGALTELSGDVSWADEAWQNLTEEEESLAQEEESLVKEIEEEERKAIDAELLDLAREEEADGAATPHPAPSTTPTADLPDLPDHPADDTANAVEKQSQTDLGFDLPPELQEYIKQLQRYGWDELVEAGGDIPTTELRRPGQGALMHEKLSSPSRKRRPEETEKRQAEKQQKAAEQRRRLAAVSEERKRELAHKIHAIRNRRRQVAETKAAVLAAKMARAEELRGAALQAVVRKAKDEEDKVAEIAFIRHLEGEGKVHEAEAEASRRKERCEKNLASIEEERARKIEEKAAREAAVEERRREREEAKSARLLAEVERRRERAAKAAASRASHDAAKNSHAKAKAREREERIAEIRAAKAQTAEQLLPRLARDAALPAPVSPAPPPPPSDLAPDGPPPSDATSPASVPEPSGPVTMPNRRWREEWEAGGSPPSHQAALLPGAETPSLPFSQPKFCTLCDVLIWNEVHLMGHLEGDAHLRSLRATGLEEVSAKELLSPIAAASAEQMDGGRSSSVDADKAKAGKKRRAKLRHKLAQKHQEYQACDLKKRQLGGKATSSPTKSKAVKLAGELKSRVASNGLDRGVWSDPDVHKLQRSLGELGRLFASEAPDLDKEGVRFFEAGGVDVLVSLVLLLEKALPGSESVGAVPVRSSVHSLELLGALATASARVAADLLYDNRLPGLLDLLVAALKCLLREEGGDAQRRKDSKTFLTIVQEVPKLFVLVVERLRDPSISWNHYPGQKSGLETRLGLLGSYVGACGLLDLVWGWLSGGSAELRQPLAEALLRVPLALMRAALDGSGGREAAVGATAAALVPLLCSGGGVGLLPAAYAVVFGRSSPAEALTEEQASLVSVLLELLNVCASLDGASFGAMVGEEGNRLGMSRLVLGLGRLCSPSRQAEAVFHPLVVLLGQLCLAGAEFRSLVGEGGEASELRGLCVLPFGYFSQPRLVRLLYPTLAAAVFRCPHNRAILEAELTATLLAEFLELLEEEAKEEAEGARRSDWTSLRHRFPSSLLQEAQGEFATPPQ